MGLYISKLYQSYYNDDLINENPYNYLSNSKKYGFDYSENVDRVNLSNYYYELYIYLDPDEIHYSIKDIYVNNAEKNNKTVEKYLYYLSKKYNLNSNTKNVSTQYQDYHHETEFESDNDSNNDSDNDNQYLDECLANNCFDSGFDLICPEDINSHPNETTMLDHKIKCCMKYQESYVGYYLYSRSSTAIKTPLRLANSVGVIDSGYRGNIKSVFDNIKNTDFLLESGTRYVQICPPNLEYPMKVYIVNDISKLGCKTNRNTGGFGSTGN